MDSRLDFVLLIPVAVLLLVPASAAQQSAPSTTSSTSSSAQHGRKAVPVAESRLDAGSVSKGVYRNPGFGFTCKLPAGRVLLAAFSRPPLARGEDVNSSILIAAESAAAYPGLKEAAQYFGPVTEIAKARGFEVVEEPYEFVVGTKTVVRGDFKKDVGSRMMRQSTLVVLARGYAVSFTFIGGSEDEVEELLAGLSVQPKALRK